MFFTHKKSFIGTSSELAESLHIQYPSLSGVSVTPKSAARFAPVYSCIRVVAESVGQLPFHVYEINGQEKQKAIDSRLYKLLHLAPNDFMTSSEWREMLVAHLFLRGNHYSFINTVRGEVRELLPLNPDAVEPVQDEDYAIRYKVTFPNGTTDILPASKIFHVKLFSVDGVKGLNPVEQARNSIGLGMATEKFGSLLFSNGARPGGILSTDQKLDEEQIALIRDSWELTQGGNDNAHKAAILQGGLGWTSIGMAADDAQFLETRKYQRSEIAGIFRVPPHMIGDLEKATFSNIEQQSIDFVMYSLVPLLNKIEQRVSLSLVPKKDQNTVFAKLVVAGLLRGDTKTRGEFYTRLLQNGALSPNEIRELEDMNPRDGGDIYLTPMNMAIDGKPVEGDKPKNEEGNDNA